MLALRMTGWRRDPELVEVPQPRPGPGQVVIRVGGAGICHSDLHVLHDYEPGSRPWALPFTLGHETAGWVHEVGEGVRGLAPGRAVAVYGPWGCGVCRWCGEGAEILCEDRANAVVPGGGGGLGADGGLAAYMLVPHPRFLVPLPDGLDPVTAAPFADAALTPYHAIARSLPVLVPGSTAVVIGAGGLGHMAVQLLAALCAARVIAVDVRREALDLVAGHGATPLLSDGDTAAEIRAATHGHGAELVLDLVGSDATLALAAQVVRIRGEVAIVGAAGGTLRSGLRTLAPETTVRSSVWGTRRELAEVLALGAAGLVRPHVTTFPLSAAASAYAQLAAGTVAGRAVIVPTAD